MKAPHRPACQHAAAPTTRPVARRATHQNAHAEPATSAAVGHRVAMSYYDPFPVVHLDRPLSLVGFIGAETNMVGRLLSSVTGLPFATLSALVAHAAGRSAADLRRAQGEAALRALEGPTLARALADRPAGVLVLDDATLLDRGNLRRVQQESTLVYVHRPFEALARRIRSDRRDHASLDGVRDEADLRALLRARAPGYAAAALRIDGGDRAPLDIAREIAGRLGWSVFEAGRGPRSA